MLTDVQHWLALLSRDMDNTPSQYSCARLLCLSNDGQDVRRVSVGLSLHSLYRATANHVVYRLGELLWPSVLHASPRLSRRGSHNVNSVKSPTWLSTVMVPPCCCVMIS
jgi:hypothetical protein